MNRTPVPQTLSVLAVLVLAIPVLHASAVNTNQVLTDAPDFPAPLPPPGRWHHLPLEAQDAILQQLEQLMLGLDPSFAAEWRNTTDRQADIIPNLVPGIYDSWMTHLQSISSETPSEAEVLEALWGVTLEVAAALGIPLATAFILPGGSLPLPGLPGLPGSPSQMAGSCQGQPGILSMLFIANCLVWPVYLVAALVILAVWIVAEIALDAALIALQVVYAVVVQLDENTDGIGDEFQDRWETEVRGALNWATDFDGDTLSNVDEFRWDLVPICTDFNKNCTDHEQDNTTGLGGDGWNDGPEVHYWDDTSNNALVSSAEGVSFYDPDRLLDSDGDGQTNVNDLDSDDDNLSDGFEGATLGSYPEAKDSDCAIKATECLPSTATTLHGARPGNPGTGDGINDDVELAAWNALGSGKHATDFDGDGINNNLLDPDADADGLLDGEEFTLDLTRQVRADRIDTDLDGLIDGQEIAWNQDTDLDGRINANDSDSDNDGMPDKWEATHNFNMVDPTDALADRDGDLLTNLGEYQHGTNPSDMDSEGSTILQGDLLLDGEEVNTYHTNPLFWDTDQDGLPDRYEVANGLQPTNPADANADPDGDGFDAGNDGSIEDPWPNLKEYRYGRPLTWDETSSGPWMGGTLPHAPDTDKDGATDGYEAHYRTNPQVPADTSTDDDQDGLTFAEESEAGTDPNRPDTDGDGLCDGGRAARCFRAGFGFQAAGEADYGTLAWTTDSDEDRWSDFGEVIYWDPGFSGKATDVDGDGQSGPVDSDSDDDGLLDGDELGRRTDPKLPDTDADQLEDGEEVAIWFTNPLVVDTDGDQLRDGQEITLHTNPALFDTDGDGLSDGAEVNVHGTDPQLPDTDADNLDDAWEILFGTQPRAPDGDADPDADSLTNYAEWFHGTAPMKSDTDNDGMPDNFEVAHNLNPRSNDRNGDADGDSLSNFKEYEAGTLPRTYDTDDDGLADGWEVNAPKSDPLAKDTDLDGMDDGEEYWTWDGLYGSAWTQNHDGDAFGNALLDADSDNDGLLDSEELRNTHTMPHIMDSDGDGLTDHTEVVTYQGQYDPNKADTDGDGQNDSLEVAIADTNGDLDKDGLKNGDEIQFGTDISVPDTDCDGIPDGPEAIYWNAWSNGGSRLLSPDVDGDGIRDGVEIGWVGTPQQAMYRTLPYQYDTDSDGLGDNEEARNTFRVSCSQAQGTSSRAIAGQALPSPVPGAELAKVQSNAALIEGLVIGKLYQESSGLMYGVDGEGLYVQGAYGVRLYVEPANLALDDGPWASLDAPQMTGAGPGSNGKLTDPLMPDSDGDGLNDGEEVLGYRNSYSGRSNANGPAGNTDPWQCDSDGDGQGDGVETGIDSSRPVRRETSAVCQQRDADPGTRTNPHNADTDKDTLPDLTEDPNSNGRMDARWNGYFYQMEAGAAPESNPLDGDTDDDGMADSEEAYHHRTNFDRDFDGLSDGLELRRTTPVFIDGVLHTDPTRTAYGINWPTWQPFQGVVGSPMTLVGTKDSDEDGILDGLEDLNHNGRFSEAYNGIKETSATTRDSDSDRRSDGHELLMHGVYDFKQFIDARGSPFAVVYNGGSFKTDPWNPHTDGTGDRAMDGLDIEPRGDALLNLHFGKFWQHDMIERSGDRYETDLALRLSMFTPAGEYHINTATLNDFGRQEGRSFSEIPIESQTYPLNMWGVAQAIEASGNLVKFNLPDDITTLTSGDTNIRVELDGFDIDAEACDWCTGNGDDVLDLSNKAGTQFADPQGVNLAGNRADSTRPMDKTWNANGNGDDIKEQHIDAQLTMYFSSTIIPYFMTSAMGTYVPFGQCLGGVDPNGFSCV